MEDKTLPSLQSIVAADDLVIHGARALTTMILIKLNNDALIQTC